MKPLTVKLPNQLAADLTEVARRRRLKIDTLVRRAVQLVYEDDLDALLGERAIAEYQANPSSFVTIEEYMRRRFPNDVPEEGERG